MEKYERLSEHSLSPENMTMYKAKEKDWKRRLAKYQDSGIIKTDGWPDAAIERRRPVSYTHLDVYKRQVMYVSGSYEGIKK